MDFLWDDFWLCLQIIQILIQTFSSAARFTMIICWKFQGWYDSHITISVFHSKYWDKQLQGLRACQESQVDLIQIYEFL